MSSHTIFLNWCIEICLVLQNGLLNSHWSNKFSFHYIDINILQQFKRLISSNFILVTYHNNIRVKHEFNCIGNIKIYHKNLVKIDNEISWLENYWMNWYKKPRTKRTHIVYDIDRTDESIWNDWNTTCVKII